MATAIKPEISKKWWSTEKPSDIKGQDLEKSLADVEKKLADAKKKRDAESIKACLAALGSLGSTAEKTIKKECDKKKHKEIISALEKFQDLCDEESEWLNEAMEALDKDSDEDGKEGEDEEEDKGILKPEYLARMIKQLRGGEQLQFCFGLNKSDPGSSRLLLCNKRKPERLQKVLKSTGEFSNRLMTFGQATGDGKTLQFALSENAKEPSQIVKLAKEFLKGNKDLKYRKVRVLCGGETFEEDMDAEAGGDLGQEVARIESLAADWQKALKSVSQQVDELRKALEAQNEPAVQKVHSALGSVMDQFPDLDLAKLLGAAKSNDRAAYNETLRHSAKEIREVHDLLSKGPLLSTIDANPFVKTTVHDTVNSALGRIVTELLATA